MESYYTNLFAKYEVANPGCFTFHVPHPGEPQTLPHIKDDQLFEVHFIYQSEYLGPVHIVAFFSNVLKLPLLATYANKPPSTYVSFCNRTVYMYSHRGKDIFLLNCMGLNLTSRSSAHQHSTKFMTIHDVINCVELQLQKCIIDAKNDLMRQHKFVHVCDDRTLDQCIIDGTLYYPSRVRDDYKNLFLKDSCTACNFDATTATEIPEIPTAEAAGVGGASESKTRDVPEMESKDGEVSSEPPFEGIVSTLTGDLLTDQKYKATKSFYVLSGLGCVYVVEEKFFEKNIELRRYYHVIFVPKSDRHDVDEIIARSVRPVEAAAGEGPLTAEWLISHYLKALSCLSDAFYNDPTELFAAVSDLLRTQMILCAQTCDHFATLMRRYALMFENNLFINDKRLAITPPPLRNTLELYPVVCALDETLDASRIAYSLLVEILANSRFTGFYKTHSSAEVFRFAFFNDKNKERELLYMLMHVSYVFQEPGHQARSMCDFKNLIDDVSHETAGNTFTSDEANILLVFCASFDLFDKFRPHYDADVAAEISTWDKTHVLEVGNFVKDAYRRNRQHKCTTSLYELRRPAFHDHNKTTSVVLHNPSTGKTKTGRIVRCQGCSTYGQQLNFMIIHDPKFMKDFINSKKVFTTEEHGPVMILDFVGKTTVHMYAGGAGGAGAPPNPDVKFTDCETKRAYETRQSQLANLRRKFNAKMRKLYKRKRHATKTEAPSVSPFGAATPATTLVGKKKRAPDTDKEIEALEKKMEELSKQKQMFEKMRFTRVLVRRLTDGTEHELPGTAFRCTHHHHGRTRPPHHKPIFWLKPTSSMTREEAGKLNFKLLKLLPHTRLALQIQALFRGKRERKKYATRKIVAKIASDAISVAITKTAAATEKPQ